MSNKAPLIATLALAGSAMFTVAAHAGSPTSSVAGVTPACDCGGGGGGGGGNKPPSNPITIKQTISPNQQSYQNNNQESWQTVNSNQETWDSSHSSSTATGGKANATGGKAISTSAGGSVSGVAGGSVSGVSAKTGPITNTTGASTATNGPITNAGNAASTQTVNGSTYQNNYHVAASSAFVQPGRASDLVAAVPCTDQDSTTGVAIGGSIIIAGASISLPSHSHSHPDMACNDKNNAAALEQTNVQTAAQVAAAALQAPKFTCEGDFFVVAVGMHMTPDQMIKMESLSASCHPVASTPAASAPPPRHRRVASRPAKPLCTDGKVPQTSCVFPKGQAMSLLPK